MIIYGVPFWKKKLFLAGAAAALLAGGGVYLRQRASAAGGPAPEFRTLGADGAALTVVKFSDLACPACARSAEVLERLARVHPAKVQLRFRHYPLTDIHKWSFDAALYADCAGRQGKFWEYAGLLFRSQEKWGRAERRPKEFSEFAGALGLDPAALNACLNDPAAERQVRADLRDGDRLKISSTPTFLINGRRAVGPEQLAAELRRLAFLLEKEGK